MRRKDHEITEKQELIEILKKNQVCRMAMCDGSRPYILPLNYGFEETEEGVVFWFHSASEGRKLEVLKANPLVCIEVDCEHQAVPNEIACKYGFLFASVLAEGSAQIVEDPAEKLHGLSCFMKGQTGEEDFRFDPVIVERVKVLRVDCKTLTGKRRSH